MLHVHRIDYQSHDMLVVSRAAYGFYQVTQAGFGPLFFGGVPSRLVVPFGALTMFHDPHVRFGLRFPVLGMDKFFVADVVPRNLPNLQYRVAPSSLATGATRHGEVDDDAKTQASVLAHIQGGPIPAP